MVLGTIVPIRYRRLVTWTEAIMSKPNPTNAGRRDEAERLIVLAQALLTDNSEQMAASYLEHALAELRMLPQCSATPTSMLA
jgi:hypothetical protein